MPKTLTRLTLAALAASLCVTAAAAQTTLEWIVVSPASEKFTAYMPKRPVSVEQRARGGGLNAEGRRYAVADGRTSFAVWSLNETTGAWRRLSAADTAAEGVGPVSLYLDGVAGLAWELLGEPEFEKLRRETGGMERAAELELGMSYVRDFELNGRPAREYFLKLEKERGPVYVTADGAHVYVLAGLGESERDPRLRKFADSFVVGGGEPIITPPIPLGPKPANPSLPVPKTIEIDPVLTKPEPRGNTGGGDAPADLDRPFRQLDVTRKAIITFKPEPGFTEDARRFNVTGVVRIRGILGSAGKVTSLFVVKPLPHGLTRKALDAARSIRFEPAQKDGRPVSQYVVFEYNFNIY